MSADPSAPIARASAASSTSTPGACYVTPKRSIHASAPAKTWYSPPPLPTKATASPSTPGRCRSKISEAMNYAEPAGVNWRFRVPDGETIRFDDQYLGPQSYTVGQDFGDFVVWRRDDVPAYQLAVVIDDAAMRITEVVRGADLLKSTARQLLLIRALGLATPSYFHCDLIRDASGTRLAKRHDVLSLRVLRQQGLTPEQVLARCGFRSL